VARRCRSPGSAETTRGPIPPPPPSPMSAAPTVARPRRDGARRRPRSPLPMRRAGPERPRRTRGRLSGTGSDQRAARRDGGSKTEARDVRGPVRPYASARLRTAEPWAPPATARRPDSVRTRRPASPNRARRHGRSARAACSCRSRKPPPRPAPRPIGPRRRELPADRARARAVPCRRRRVCLNAGVAHRMTSRLTAGVERARRERRVRRCLRAGIAPRQAASRVRDPRRPRRDAAGLHAPTSAHPERSELVFVRRGVTTALSASSAAYARDTAAAGRWARGGGGGGRGGGGGAGGAGAGGGLGGGGGGGRGGARVPGAHDGSP
jgi:hypothetical protein